MANNDVVLNGLVRDLGLEWPAGLGEWEERLQDVLEPEVYAQYMEARMGFGPGPGGPRFFEFAGNYPALALLLAEGRLGYHAAVLPAFTGAVAAGPHASVVDLGCGCGVGTLYLARRFPGSRVVGVEQSPGLAGLAAALRDRAKVPNADFICGDYVGGGTFGGPFDVAVTMQAMPAFLLPYLPSERPEGYGRGEAMRALAADPMLPHRQVRRCLEAVRGLLTPSGRAVTHERTGDISRILLFAYLANEARLGTRAVRVLEWESPNEAKPGRHFAPLVVLEAITAPAPFDEDHVLRLLHPPASRPIPTEFGPSQIAVVSGPLAADAFDGFGLAARTPSVRAAYRDGRRTHLYLGATPSRLAFAYCCDTFDGRELRLGGALTAAQVFAAAAEPLLGAAQAGKLLSLDPPRERIPALLRSLLGG